MHKLKKRHIPNLPAEIISLELAVLGARLQMLEIEREKIFNDQTQKILKHWKLYPETFDSFIITNLSISRSKEFGVVFKEPPISISDFPSFGPMKKYYSPIVQTCPLMIKVIGSS